MVWSKTRNTVTTIKKYLKKNYEQYFTAGFNCICKIISLLSKNKVGLFLNHILNTYIDLILTPEVIHLINKTPGTCDTRQPFLKQRSKIIQCAIEVDVSLKTAFHGALSASFVRFIDCLKYRAARAWQLLCDMASVHVFRVWNLFGRSVELSEQNVHF